MCSLSRNGRAHGDTMAYSKQMRLPKRRIEKVVCTFDDTMTNAQVDRILHTAEDKKTLVRTVVDLHTEGWAGAAAGSQGVRIMHIPSTMGVPAMSIAQALDVEPGKTEMFKACRHQAVQPAAGNVCTQHAVQVDLKGMRKMDVGDTITLSHLATNANQAFLTGTITLFFKE